MLINVEDAVSVDIGSIGIRELPSVLIVDSAGRELGLWSGPLSSADERSIRLQVQNLLLERTAKLGPTTSEVAALINSAGDYGIVDARSRAEFRLLHINGAVNIPLDELEIRLPVEFSSGQRLLFFCGSPDDSPDDISNCLTHLNASRRDDIQVIPHSLEDLERGGIKMSRQ